MSVPMAAHRFVEISFTAQCIDRSGAKIEEEAQINKRMKELFKEGNRRFRTLKLRQTNDHSRFLILAWPS